MKVKHKIKKYKYLFGKKISEYLSYTSRRLKSNISKTDPRKVSPLEVDKLPYPVSWGEYFDYDELVVEIGTGHGELLKFLSEKPDRLSIGFEITKTYTLKTSKEVEGKTNSYAFKGDGYSLALNLFEKESIDLIYILFPDPWHKKRHHKRRPLKKEWFEQIHRNLTSKGKIYFATDWMEYYQFVEDQIDQMLKNNETYTLKKGVYSPKNAGLVSTHYYEKWVEDGREFKFIELQKTDHSSM